MSAQIVVPRCGRVGCDLDRTDREHSHEDFGPGDRVVVEAKRPTAPGWTYTNPAGLVVAREPGAPSVGLRLDDGRELEVAADLLTRWHSWRRRPHHQPGARTLPRLSRLHAIDPELDVVEPQLFEVSE